MRTAILVVVLMTAFSALSQSITPPSADPPRIDPNNPPKLDPPKDPPGPAPDLVISMFAPTQNPAFLNENFAVNVEVKNIGAGIATDVNVTITIPPGNRDGPAAQCRRPVHVHGRQRQDDVPRQDLAETASAAVRTNGDSYAEGESESAG